MGESPSASRNLRDQCRKYLVESMIEVAGEQRLPLHRGLPRALEQECRQDSCEPQCMDSDAIQARARSFRDFTGTGRGTGNNAPRAAATDRCQGLRFGRWRRLVDLGCRPLHNGRPWRCLRHSLWGTATDWARAGVMGYEFRQTCRSVRATLPNSNQRLERKLSGGLATRRRAAP